MKFLLYHYIIHLNLAYTQKYNRLIITMIMTWYRIIINLIIHYTSTLIIPGGFITTLYFKLLPLMVTLSFTLLASLAMGVALQQSTVPFLNYLKSLFLLILLLSLLVLDFPFLLILLSHLLFSQSIAHLLPLFLISSPISPLFSRILPLLTPN